MGNNWEDPDSSIGLIDVSGADTNMRLNEHCFSKKNQTVGLEILDVFVKSTENSNFAKKSYWWKALVHSTAENRVHHNLTSDYYFLKNEA